MTTGGTRCRVELIARCLALTWALSALLVGCSAQNWYEGARQGAQQPCQGLPPGAYQDCVNRNTLPSYEDYRKEREQSR